MTDRRKDTSRFVTTRGRLEWSEELQQFVTVEREGYLYDGPWALAMDTPPVWVAEDYRFYDDDGVIGSATPLGNENTAIDASPGDQLRLRGNFGETNNAAGTGEHTGGWTLYYRINTGTWTQLGAASDVRYFDSTHLSNGTAIASANYVLSWSGGGVQRDWGDECEDGVTISQTWSNDYCEAEWTVDLFNVSAGDTVEFRLRAPDGTSDVAFTSVPTINVAAVAKPAADTLTITETTPVRFYEETVRPSHYAMRVYSVVGLQFRGITPTVSISGGTGNTENPDAGTLTISELTPTRLVNHIVQPTTRALSITEETPVRVLNDFVVAGAADALVITEETPARLVNHIVQPGADALTITEETPQIPLVVKPGADSLTITEETPDPLLNHITSPTIDELVITEETPVRIYGLLEQPASDSLSISENGITLNTAIAVPADTLDLVGLLPIRSVTILTTPGAGSLTITEETPLPSILITAGNPDPLIITGETPDPLVNHIASTGADTLEFNSDAPSVSVAIPVSGDTLALGSDNNALVAGVSVDSDSLAITETTSTLVSSIAVDADALTFGGDVPLVVSAGNTIKQPDADTLTLGGDVATIGAGVSVPVDALTINSDAPLAFQPITLEPGADSLSFSGLQPIVGRDRGAAPTVDTLAFGGDAPTIGVGVSVPADSLVTSGQSTAIDSAISVGSDGLTIATPTFVVGDQIVLPAVASLSVTGYAPDRDVAGYGTEIVNTDATTVVPTNYVICDQSGFRQIPGSLRYTWKGYGVRRKSYEERNQQENMRSASHRWHRGPRSPEPDDAFIEDLYENGLDPEDL